MSSNRPKQSRKKKSSDFNGPVIAALAAIAVIASLGIGYGFGRMRSSFPPVVNNSPDPALNNPVSASIAPNAGTLAVPPQVPTTPTLAPQVSPPSSGSRDDDEANASVDAKKASDDFFRLGMIPNLKIQISDAEMEKLSAGPRTFVIGDPRPFVEGTIVENDQQTYKRVAIKLKGSAGSFRPVDDRPALTINISKNEKDQSFHGFSKFHLNNSVQDDTYLHEWLCEELFRAARLPATRVTHARVWLNNRDLGLYVLKSAFDKSFLERHFDSAKGNLYEGGFLQDIDSELELDSGKSKADRSDLISLLSACREPDSSTRWDRIDEFLNVDQFISFMAMEMMVGHWDGYTLNHNNYRLYFEPKSKRAHFIPHGMDQVFGDPNASIINFPSSIVGSAVMLNAEWRARYRERVTELMELFSPTDNLLKRIDAASDRLKPVLGQINPQAAQSHEEGVKGLKARIVARVEGLIRQNSQSDPKPRDFDASGRLNLASWYPVSESPDAKLEILEMSKGLKAYSILCGKKSQCNASWRCKELLARGSYVLHAKLKANQIAAREERNVAVGAGVRIDGMTRTNIRRGSSSWGPVQFKFTVEEEVRNVEFIAELRARTGQVWYEVDSLYLTKEALE